MPELKRSLKLPSVIFYGVGAILGAGIYVLIGEVTALAGYYAPLSFLVASLIAVFSSFSYAELSAAYPRSAGEAVYIDKAFGKPRLTLLTGLLVIITGIVSAATMSTGIVGYVQLLAALPTVLIIVSFVAIIGGIACWGIQQSAVIITIITLVEIAGLLFVVFVASGDTVYFPTALPQQSLADISVLSGVLLGGFLAFYAFIGFEDMVNIAEEIVEPSRILPTAILSALLISAALYIAVSYAALSVLTPMELGRSAAPLADVVTQKGYSGQWISLISLVAVINGAIVQLIMASRVIYGLAAKQQLPAVLAVINGRTSTPINATLIVITLTLLLALLFPLSQLAQATSIVVLLIFSLVNLANIRLRSLASQAYQPLYPVWIPWIGLLLCAGMLLIKAISVVT